MIVVGVALLVVGAALLVAEAHAPGGVLGSAGGPGRARGGGRGGDRGCRRGPAIRPGGGYCRPGGCGPLGCIRGEEVTRRTQAATRFGCRGAEREARGGAEHGRR